ncbi:hypothetical protein U9M48_026153 [Paspalum notatum var. saurae]|uniref:Uncharacterized protein n=1 Tax=Paspalum notatum var. saurae TaxID=547442 RepID=A0AAQ3WYH8_PASNO
MGRVPEKVAPAVRRSTRCPRSTAPDQAVLAAEQVADGVGEAVQTRGEAGQLRPERVVEAGGDRVDGGGARARWAQHPRRRRAPDEPHVDDAKLPRAHPLQQYLKNGRKRKP